MNILNLRPERFRAAVLFFVPLLTIAFMSPALAQRTGNRAGRNNARMQSKAPQRTQRQAPRVQRQASQRRQVTRPQRERAQVTRRPQQRRQVTRSLQQRQVNRAPRQQRQGIPNSPQRQQVTDNPQRQQRQRMTNNPRGPQRQQITNNPRRQQRRKMTDNPRGPQRQQVTNNPQRQERRKMTDRPQRQEWPQATNRPVSQDDKDTRRPRRSQANKRPQRGGQDRRGSRFDDGPQQSGYANQNRGPGRHRNDKGVSLTRPGRIDTRQTRPTQQVVQQPLNTGARRGATTVVNDNTNTNVNVNRNYNYNQNFNVNRNVVVSRPAYTYAAPNVCPPAYSVVNNYNPYAYANYCDRRDYRRRFRNNCSWPLLVLGFFISRPYSSYDHARVDYNNQPYFYGDDTAYQASSVAGESEGGPAAVAAADLESKEEQMLIALSEHVQTRSVDGAYQIPDAAFNGQFWNLDLAQAPAVFEIQDGLYSVVAGFEGTLGTAEVPSNVNVEFFVARTANGYEVRDAWITSANGIPRNRLYQSPVYPDVSTWESGRLCPFTGQEMVPMEAPTSDHG